MRTVILLVLIVGMTASCSRISGGLGRIGLGKASANRSQVEINATRFRARTSAEREDRRAFSVTVSPVAADPDGARAAGRYQATRYCLLTYGGSDKEWTIGPDLPIEELPVDGDTLTLAGRCTQK